MATLYPLKFTPVLKEKIWGGNKIETILKHQIGSLKNCGESWEISGIVDDESVVANGFLAENNLNELMEIYLTDLVGEKNYEKYGLGFPSSLSMRRTTFPYRCTRTTHLRRSITGRTARPKCGT